MYLVDLFVYKMRKTYDWYVGHYLFKIRQIIYFYQNPPYHVKRITYNENTHLDFEVIYRSAYQYQDDDDDIVLIPFT